MDELNIKTHFIKDLIGKAIRNALKKNDILAHVYVTDLSMTHKELERVKIHICLDIEASEADILETLSHKIPFLK